MRLLNSKIYNLYRANTGSYYKGNYRIAGGYTDINNVYIAPPKSYLIELECNIQPALRYKDFVSDNHYGNKESSDLIGSIKIFANEKLKSIDQKNVVKSDNIVFENKVYEIRSIGEHYGTLLTHYKHLAILNDKITEDDLIADIGNPTNNNLMAFKVVASHIVQNTVLSINDNGISIQNLSNGYFLLGSSSNEYQNNLNLRVQRNGIPQGKNGQVFWVSPTEFFVNSDLYFDEDIVFII